MPRPSTAPLPRLTGRERESVHVDALLGCAGERGAALLLRGGPGSGKSALLAEAGRLACARGMRVLATSAIASEAALPFAGLHQLLRPLLPRIGALGGPRRGALQTALGMASGPPPDALRVGLAMLDLLALAAADAPLLLIADDVHWLDTPSADALCFAARRLDTDAVVLLAAQRDGDVTAFELAGLDELRVDALDDDAAAELLAARAPGLRGTLRARVLEEAAGNPLALCELAVTLPAAGERALLTERIPLTPRLERAFAARLAEFPRATGTALLALALGDGVALADVLAAASRVTGDALTPDVLAPAATARILDGDDAAPRLRHPLARAAISQRASLGERLAVHAALAAVLHAEPERRAWHRAAAATRPDDALAEALERAAQQARDRGDPLGAVRALVRSAGLAVDARAAVRRTLDAAELAVELGLGELAADLLREIAARELTPREAVRLSWLRDARARGLDFAARVATDGDVDLALQVLAADAQDGFCADRGGVAARTAILGAARRLPTTRDDHRMLAIRAFADPVGEGPAVIAALSRLPAAGTRDAARNGLLARTASVVGDPVLAERFCSPAVVGLREQGRVVALAPALVTRAWSEIHAGRWARGRADAAEAARVARDTGQPVAEACAEAAGAVLAALRGDAETTDAHAARGAQLAQARGARGALAVVQLARGVLALGDGRNGDAYEQLARMFDPADPAHHRFVALDAIGYLADAAAHSDHLGDGRLLLAGVERVAGGTPSPRLHVALRHARALLAGDAGAEDLFHAALAPGDARGPFDWARLQLAYGVWLRRRRRVADSRAPLRTARDAFAALGAVAWCDRAQQELRASGQTLRRLTDDTRDELTPQELQIALLVADGLSNREIGDRLFLSHRTVGSHLYRIFPKLGITSRTELRSALPADVPVAA